MTSHQKWENKYDSCKTQVMLQSKVEQGADKNVGQQLLNTFKDCRMHVYCTAQNIGVSCKNGRCNTKKSILFL